MASFRLREWVWDRPFIVLALLLPAILVPHLLDLGYWRSDPETLAIGGGSAMIGLALAIVEWKAPRVANLLIAVAIYWLFDVYFDDRGLAAVGVTAVVAFLLWSRFSDDFRRMIVVFSCFWLAANLSMPVKPLLEPPLADVPPRSRHHELPLIVHIVLDEQMSPLALPDTIPPGSPAHSLIDDYLDRGFTVFARANSSSPWTSPSLSQLVSFKLDSSSAKLSLSRLRAIEADPNSTQDLFAMTVPGSARVLQNRYFEKLHELGYSISTIQSEYLKFCLDNIVPGDECSTYMPGGHGHTLSLLSTSFTNRLAFALDSLRDDYRRKFVKAHSVLLYRLATEITGFVPYRGVLSRPIAMLAILDRLEQRLRDPEPGRAYFAHIMLPHSPYVFDQYCALKDWRNWAAADFFGPGWGGVNPHPAFWEQVGCTHRRILAIIDRVRRTPRGRDAIFMIHGDHGSRISFYDTATRDRLDGADMLATFLAVKMPGAEGGRVSEPVNLQEAFARSIDDLVARLRK